MEMGDMEKSVIVKNPKNALYIRNDRDRLDGS